MKKYFMYLLTLMACLICTTNAQAEEVDSSSSVISLEKNTTVQLTLDPNSIAHTLGCNTTDLEVYAPADNGITNQPTANKGGFWFSSKGVVCSWNGSDSEGNPYTFYLEPATVGDFSTWNVGQNDIVTKSGECYKTTLYFFNKNSETNTDYYAVNVTINITGPIITPLTDLEYVGEAECTLNIDYYHDTWGKVNFSVDLNAIATKLGVDYSVVTMKGLSEEGKLTTATTATKGGWWLDSNGFVTAWAGSPYFYIEPTSDKVWTSFNVGYHPTNALAGKTYVAKLYFINGEEESKYYELTVKLHMNEIYTRNVTSGNFGTIALDYKATMSGATLYEVASFDKTEGLVLTEVGTDMEAGKPYIFRANEDMITCTEVYDGTDRATHADKDCTQPTVGNGLVGCYTDCTFKEDLQGCYIIANNQLRKIVSTSGVTLNANRCFFNPQYCTTSTESSEVKVCLPIVGSETAISGVNAALSEGKVYDLNGRDVKQMQKGQIYIMSGKKVLNK